MGSTDEQHEEVVVGELLDEEQSAIQHTIREGFDKLTPTERRLMSERGNLAKAAKRAAKKMAELEAWTAAHRERAGELYQIKWDTIDGLRSAATDEDGVFNPKLLSMQELKLLLTTIKEWEDAGFKSEPKKDAPTNQVNVIAILADLKKSLGSGG